MSLETEGKRNVKEDVGGLCALKVLPGPCFLLTDSTLAQDTNTQAETTRTKTRTENTNQAEELFSPPGRVILGVQFEPYSFW